MNLSALPWSPPETRNTYTGRRVFRRLTATPELMHEWRTNSGEMKKQGVYLGAFSMGVYQFFLFLDASSNVDSLPVKKSLIVTGGAQRKRTSLVGASNFTADDADYIAKAIQRKSTVITCTHRQFLALAARKDVRVPGWKVGKRNAEWVATVRYL